MFFFYTYGGGVFFKKKEHIENKKYIQKLIYGLDVTLINGIIFYIRYYVVE